MKGLKIRSATYGAGSQKADVTDAVRAAVDDLGLVIGVGNGSLTPGTDPAPNQPKVLHLRWQVGRKKFDQEWPEGAIVTIEA